MHTIMNQALCVYMLRLKTLIQQYRNMNLKVLQLPKEIY